MPRIIKSIYTCPKCGHPVGWWRKLNTGIFTHWPCATCGTILKVNHWKHLVFSFIVALLIYLWINPQSSVLAINLFVIGLIIGVHLVKMFMIPIAEKRPRQSSDSE